MNTIKMYVMHDIEEYRKQIKMSYAQLADIVLKDATVIKRQLTEVKGGVQLNTAYELADAVGGVVKFIPQDQLGEITSAERESLNAQISTLMATNAAQEAEIERLNATISLLQKRVIDKDERLERKDDLIRQLLIEKNIIKE